MSSPVANVAELIPQPEVHITAAVMDPFKAYRESDISLPTYAVYVSVPKIPNSSVQVKEIFFVRLEVDGDQYCATSPISLIYEYGNTRKEALHNYLDALTDHLEWLNEESATLASPVQEELALLRRYLRV